MNSHYRRTAGNPRETLVASVDREIRRAVETICLRDELRFSHAVEDLLRAGLVHTGELAEPAPVSK